jgi:starvation-inducible DNA-binding protein
MEHSLEDQATYHLPVMIQPNVGLDSNCRQAINDLLNVALSDEIILAAKMRSLHWNIQGPTFLKLRTFLSDQYHCLSSLSDEMAERVRMLGGFPFGSLCAFLEHARLKEQPGDGPDLMHLLADHETLTRFLREDAKRCLEEFEDEGTRDLLVSAIRCHEKAAWMLRSHIAVEDKRP